MRKTTKHSARKAPNSRRSSRQPEGQIRGHDDADEESYVEVAQPLAYRAYYSSRLHFPSLQDEMQTNDEKLRLKEAQEKVELKDDLTSDGITLRAAANKRLAQPLHKLPEREFSSIRFESKLHTAMGCSVPLLLGGALICHYSPVHIPIDFAGNPDVGIAGNTGSGIDGHTAPVSADLSQPQAQVQPEPEHADKASAAPGFIAGLMQTLSNVNSAFNEFMVTHDVLKIAIPGASAAPAKTRQTNGDMTGVVDPEVGLSRENTYLAKRFGLDGVGNADMATILVAGIGSLNGTEEAFDALARDILRGRGHFGGHPDEQISRPAKKAHIRTWAAENIFGGSLETFIVKKILERDPIMPTTTIANLNSFVINENLLKKSQVPDGVDHWILDNVIRQMLPVLRYESEAEMAKIFSMDLRDWEWGVIHAGLLFYRNSVPHNEPNISVEKALEMGRLLLTQLAEGSAPEQLKYLFKLPAMVRYLLKLANEGSKVTIGDKSMLVDGALEDYFSAYELQRTESDPFEKFDSVFKKFDNRVDLAKKFLEVECPGKDGESYIGELNPFCEVLDLDTPEGRAEEKDLRNDQKMNGVKNIFDAIQPSPGEALVGATRTLGVDMSGGERGFYLENINDKFDRQNQEIAKAYGNRDKLLILDALIQLAGDEFDFIAGAKVERRRVEFSALAPFLKTSMGNTPEFRAKYVISLDQGLEFFQAINGHEKRMFALSRKSDGYRFIRVDEDRSNFYQFLDNDKRPVKDNNFVLKIYPANEVLKHADQPIDEAFIAQIVATHEKDFKKQLHDMGYEKTFKEGVREFLLSLIPFYSCISSIAAGKEAEGTVSCLMDAAMLIPVAGRLAVLSGKFSQSLALGGLTTMRNAMAETAARESLRAFVKKFGRDFFQHAIKPASKVLSRKNMASVGVDLFQSFDPFLEFGLRIGRASVQQMIRLSQHISGLFPDAMEILKRMEHTMIHRPSPVTTDQYVMAHMRSHDREVAVTRLGGAKYRGKPVYARINPETGDVFGVKYTLSHRDELSPIPVNVARNLKNSYEFSPTMESVPDLANKMKSVPDKNAVPEQSPLQSGQTSQVRVEAKEVQIKEPMRETVTALKSPDENMIFLTKEGVSDSVAVPVHTKTMSGTAVDNMNRIGIPAKTVGDANSPMRELDDFDNEIYYRTMSEEDFAYLQRTGTLKKGQESSISPSPEYSSKYDGITVRLTVRAGTSAKLRAIAISANVKTQKITEIPVKNGQWSKHVRFKSEGNQMTTQLGKGDGLALFNENLLQFEQVEKIQKLNRRGRRAIRRRARNNHAERSRRGRYSGPMR